MSSWRGMRSARRSQRSETNTADTSRLCRDSFRAFHVCSVVPRRRSMVMADVKPQARTWPPSSIVLILAGVALIGTGLYFIVLRPPLLPEDVRYMALPGAQFDV